MIAGNEILKRIKEVKDKAEKDDGKSHAVYGASTAERWKNCHGSVALLATVPKRPSGPAALEGSLAHLCLEIMIEHRDEILDTKMALQKHFPGDMVDHCFETWEYLVNRAKKTKGATLYSEQKVDSSHFTKPGQFGTVDCALVEEFGLLRVTDFKYGRGVVEAKDNLQMIYYALAISKQFDHNFSEVEIEIIQPRAEHRDGKIRVHRMGMEELLAHEKPFRQAVKECEGPNPALNAGPWCKWCDAKAVCPAIGNEKAREAGIDFDEIPDELQENFARKELAESLKPAQLSKILAAFEYVEMYIKAVREHAHQLVESGKRINGYCLVDKRADRKWASEKVATEAKKMWGPVAFSPAALLPPAQLEKVLSVEFDKKAVEAWVAKRTVKESSGKNLVPVSKTTNEFSDIPGKKITRGKKNGR